MADPVKILEPIPNATEITVELNLPLGTITVPNDVSDTNNFLRGDGTWAVPPGGAGGSSKSQEFLTSGTFDVPVGVSLVWATEIGGGGAGSGSNADAPAGGGGGSAEYRESLPMNCTPEGTLTIVVGAAGVGGVATTGTDGGDSSVSNGVITFLVKGGKAAILDSSGAGGGINGAPAGGDTGGLGVMGTIESTDGFGGGSGGLGGNLITVGDKNGAGNVGVPIGAAGGTTNGNTAAGGGGGAASPYGIGGAGGNGGSDGSNAPAGSYGAGGGGSGGKIGGVGGDGGGGYVLIEWIG